MINRRIDDITADDLQLLVTNAVEEGRTIEFKEQLPGGTDAERKEFLADVSSFANAAGGDLIYGIRERRQEGRATGIAEGIEGIDAPNRDTVTQRLENMMRDGIAPRLVGVRPRWIDGFPTGPVLIVRIPQSWSGPHMVTFQQHSRFYSRTSAGKYPLDVQEIRDAFLSSGSAAERLQQFRVERLGKLLAADAPVTLVGDNLICVHVLPHRNLTLREEIDLAAVAAQGANLSPFHSAGFSSRYNLDGHLSYADRNDGRSHGYLQVFRTGSLETVDAMMLAARSGTETGVPSVLFARELFGFTQRFTNLYRAIGIEPPLTIFVSLLGVKGHVLHVSSELALLRGRHTFDRDVVMLPELTLHDLTGDPTALVKPILDHLWQAAGYERCLDYNAQGRWNPQR